MDRFTVTAPPTSTSGATASATDSAAQVQQHNLPSGDYHVASVGPSGTAMSLGDGIAEDNPSRMSRDSCHDSQVGLVQHVEERAVANNMTGPCYRHIICRCNGWPKTLIAAGAHVSYVGELLPNSLTTKYMRDPRVT